MAKTLQVLRTNQKVRVGKILCVCSNYSKHLDEMGSARPEVPLVFTKPTTALIKDGETIVIPPYSNNAHHEVELVVVIGRRGKNISKEQVNDYILGYALGLDITLRDTLAEASDKGRPWSVAKGFDTSAPLTDILPRDEVPNPQDINLSLWVNKELRQDGSTKDMIFKIDEIVSYLSTVYTLEANDVIFTGTLDGVGQILPGDMVSARLGDLITLDVNVA
ncbi:MAG: fumarylacetoacetate hydrolase family protein [bacterium]|nr:fumarylacetoacetate hydrolase family protein [bacterium]